MVDLLLPDGHHRLELVHAVLARLHRVRAVGRGNRDDDARFFDRNKPGKNEIEAIQNLLLATSRE